ncbi:MAG: hypothetical protein WKF94_00265 [Solirubrobacteraceae bacterium]
MAGEFSEIAFFVPMVALSFAAGLVLRHGWALLLPIGAADVYLIIAYAVISGDASTEWDSLSRIVAVWYFLELVFLSEVGMVAGMAVGSAFAWLRRSQIEAPASDGTASVAKLRRR